VHVRRPRWAAPIIVGLALSLAACGSQLDPDTVRAANGGAGGVAADGTLTGDGSIAGGTGTTGDTGSAAGGDTGTGAAAAGGAGSGAAAGGGGAATEGDDPPPIASKGINCDGFKNGPGITDKTITLANVSDLSGPVPGLFQPSYDGAKAFVTYFNATSDICGRKLELQSYDSRTDSGGDQQGYAKACEGAFATVGSMSAFDSGGAKTAEACSIPDVRTASVTFARSACPVCFGASAVNTNFFENAVPDYVIKNFKAASQKAAMIYLNAGAAAENGKGQVNAMTRRGMKFVYVQGVDTSEFNYAPFVQQLKEKGARYVQALGSYQHGVKLAQAMEQAGFKPDIFMMDVVAYDPGFVESGGSAVEGTTAFINFVPFEQAGSNGEIQLYLKYLQQVAPGAKPNWFGVFGWSAARLFVTEAAKLGGRLNRDALISRLKGVANWTANGMHAPQDVGARNTADCWRFLQLQKGKWVPKTNGYLCNGVSSTK
jgi:ABC-type branched-subunit amino acid transport system substrate-binding protein